ncbi:MAG: Na+/H+ antiporter NhaC, partial [Alishewanella sp.]|nr:Na+/H+ antiporter NhaC [Alishewanella sp.]
FNSDVSADFQHITDISNILQQQFNISLWSLVPLLVLLVMAIKKVPAFPTVFIGALLGGVWAVLFQDDLLSRLASDDLPRAVAVFKIIWQTLFAGFSISTGNESMDDLLSGGGMASMLNTIWLIFSAMVFGAVVEHIGLLRKFVEAILKLARSSGSLIVSTMGTCLATNILTADQYISIVMPGRMFKEEYQRRNLAPVNLSRALEDGGTITSPLIPWNTCGAYMHGVLNVNPLDYFIYAFFNLINPILAVIYAYMGIKILKLTPPKSVVERVLAN